MSCRGCPPTRREDNAIVSIAALTADPSDGHADEPVVDRPDDGDGGAAQPHDRVTSFDGRPGLGRALAPLVDVEITGQKPRSRERRDRGMTDARLSS